MRHPILAIVLLHMVWANSIANAQGIASYRAIHHPEYGENGMVVAQNRVPAEVGAAILEQGGNAVDAAVAVGFALGVTLPRAGNIGGGGFMLLYDAESDATIAIDYREMAPLGATRDMFLDADGFYYAHKEYGRLPWQQVVQPAIDLARDGILVTHDLATQLARRQERLCGNEAACEYFFKPGRVPYKMGERLVQTDLADTLALIAEQGADAF
jgi:gamma-glutamyltranspeptidase/glutathione hydrolase